MKTTCPARSTAHPVTSLIVAAAAAAVAITAGCGGGGGGSSPAADTVDAYMKALPTWAAYSPPQADLDPYVAGTPGITTPARVGTVDYVCQTTPYAIQRTPTELVMYSPNVEVLWPGSLLQGRSYKDGADVNALLALTIAERTPIKVSIPAFAMADNYREVVPDLGTVNGAVGAIVGAATAAHLTPPSTTQFEMEAYRSEEQFALSLGLSGRYMGFSAKASFNYDQSASENTIVVHFMEKMYEVVVAPPQTPRAFFSSAFTQAKLDEQIALGRMGPDNLPIYVSNVVYGRMFTFALTSTESEEKIRAALQAAYSFGVGEVSTDIGTTNRTLIQNSKISIATVGGDPENVLSVIRSGDWRDYFSKRPALSSATPLSYTFRSLADGAVALVTETTSYDYTVCEPALAGGFLSPQAVSLSLTPPFDAQVGDLNGDGRDDLVWNHRGTTNEVKVAFARMDGTFDLGAAAATIAGSPGGGWTAFQLVVEDVDGDGRDDLVWNRVANGTSETRVALSRGDGTFDPLHVTTRAEAGMWSAPLALARAHVVAGVDATPPHGLLWSRLTDAGNAVAATAWSGTTPIDLAPQALAPPAGGWGPYAGYGTLVGDLDGDGADDLAYGAVGQVCSAFNDGAGAFTMKPVVSSSMACTYTCPVESGFRVADVNGDGRADVLRYSKSFATRHYCPCTYFLGCWCAWATDYAAATQVLVSNGAGGFSATSTQLGWATMPVDPVLVDVTGDGRADLVWITLTDKATIRVAKAETNASGAFTGFVLVPDHAVATAPPDAANWNGFRALFADVNGDGRTDVVLTDNKSVGYVYVDVR